MTTTFRYSQLEAGLFLRELSEKMPHKMRRV
jgi:hypothetical protein